MEKGVGGREILSDGAGSECPLCHKSVSETGQHMVEPLKPGILGNHGQHFVWELAVFLLDSDPNLEYNLS